jgi:OOP family OmpA-OmpF porin
MSKSKSFLWILLTTWILGSTYWHVFELKNSDPKALKSQLTEMDTIPLVEPAKIALAEKPVQPAKGGFSFARSGDSLSLDPVKNVLDSLRHYAVVHNKLVTITGFYSTDETNNTVFPNLGLARAFRIKKYFLRKGLPDSLIKFRARVKTDMVMDADSVRDGIELGLSSRTTATFVQ